MSESSIDSVLTENRSFPVTIVREEISAQSVRSKMIEPGYAWLRVSQFQDRTVEDFATKLQRLRTAQPGGRRVPAEDQDVRLPRQHRRHAECVVLFAEERHVLHLECQRRVVLPLLGPDLGDIPQHARLQGSRSNRLRNL